MEINCRLHQSDYIGSESYYWIDILVKINGMTLGAEVTLGAGWSDDIGMQRRVADVMERVKGDIVSGEIEKWGEGDDWSYVYRNGQRLKWKMRWE